jgi:hypothetical protein
MPLTNEALCEQQVLGDPMSTDAQAMTQAQLDMRKRVSEPRMFYAWEQADYDYYGDWPEEEHWDNVVDITELALRNLDKGLVSLKYLSEHMVDIGIDQRMLTILVYIFGLDHKGMRSLEETSIAIGRTKERVRQIRNIAMSKIAGYLSYTKDVSHVYGKRYVYDVTISINIGNRWPFKERVVRMQYRAHCAGCLRKAIYKELPKVHLMKAERCHQYGAM